MHSVMRLPGSGQRVGGYRRNGRSDCHHRSDGTVEISVTSQTAGTSAVTAVSTAVPRAGT